MKTLADLWLPLAAVRRSSSTVVAIGLQQPGDDQHPVAR